MATAGIFFFKRTNRIGNTYFSHWNPRPLYGRAMLKQTPAHTPSNWFASPAHLPVLRQWEIQDAHASDVANVPASARDLDTKDSVGIHELALAASIARNGLSRNAHIWYFLNPFFDLATLQSVRRLVHANHQTVRIFPRQMDTTFTRAASAVQNNLYIFVVQHLCRID